MNLVKTKALNSSQVPTPLALLGLMVDVERVSAILSLRGFDLKKSNILLSIVD
jgi:hypothetical protein